MRILKMFFKTTRIIFSGTLLILCTSLAMAQPTIATPDGFAAQQGTTGGGNASPQTVTSASAFKSAVDGSGSKVIIVDGRLNVGTVSIGSNTTIVGKDENAGLYGGTIQLGGDNYIIQNISFGPAGGDDMMEISGATRVFITKCDFHDSDDELCSIVRQSDWVTVSWCKFYFDNPDSHSFGSLIGNSDGATDDRGKLHVTMHHNWYAHGIIERMPRVRFGQVHIYNNLYESDNDNYCIGVGFEANIYAEECYFINQNQVFYEWGNGEATYVNFEMINSNLGYNPPESDFRPPYSYSADPVANVPSLVRAGAGNVIGSTIINVTGVAVSPTSTTVSIGGSTVLTAIITPSNATNQNVSWSSSNESIATVNSSGVVTSIAKGLVTITVTTQEGGFTANASITVQETTECTWIEYQAEDGEMSSGSIDDNNSGFTGTGFANTDNELGVWYEIVVNVPTSGVHPVSVRYANGSSTDRAQEISVNGSSQIASQSFISTNSWTTWETVEFSLNLNAGNNTIRFTSLTSDGAANIDRIDVCQGGGSLPTYSLAVNGSVSTSVGKYDTETTATITALYQPTSETLKSLNAYPNPFSGSTTVEFSLRESKDVEMTIISLDGIIIMQTAEYYPAGMNKVELNAPGLEAGIYVLIVNTSDSRITQRLIIH